MCISAQGGENQVLMNSLDYRHDYHYSCFDYFDYLFDYLLFIYYYIII